MNDRMFSEISSIVTQGVRVNVRSAYLKEESRPDEDHFVFAYQVQIVNESPYKIQLLRRKWNIIDGLGRRRMVAGEGVVGRKPILMPGESHEYVSGCNFNTPIGQMSGHYTLMRVADGTEFTARIPSFTMVLPWLLN